MLDGTYAKPLTDFKARLMADAKNGLLAANPDPKKMESLVRLKDELKEFIQLVDDLVCRTISGTFCIPHARDKQGIIPGIYVVQHAGWNGYFDIDFYHRTIIYVLARHDTQPIIVNTRTSLLRLVAHLRQAGP